MQTGEASTASIAWATCERLARTPIMFFLCCASSSASRASTTTRSRTARRTANADTPIRVTTTFAHLSYAYTLTNTSNVHREWLRKLPGQLRTQLRRYKVLLCHGSPRRINEFLRESTTSTAFLEHLLKAHHADVILSTHTGIKWKRRLASERHFINFRVLGRPGK